jgi:uncharacterized membrane protein YhaH (DUF805 family)
MPTEASPESSVHDSDSGGPGIWIQWLLIVGVFVASWICLRTFAEIGPAELRFRDELGGKPLPPVTEFLLQYRTVFLFAIVFIPMAALATFAFHDRVQACWLLVGLGLASTFEAFTVYTALRLPFIEIVKTMGGSAGR